MARLLLPVPPGGLRSRLVVIDIAFIDNSVSFGKLQWRAVIQDCRALRDKRSIFMYYWSVLSAEKARRLYKCSAKRVL